MKERGKNAKVTGGSGKLKKGVWEQVRKPMPPPAKPHGSRKKPLPKDDEAELDLDR